MIAIKKGKKKRSSELSPVIGPHARARAYKIVRYFLFSPLFFARVLTDLRGEIRFALYICSLDSALTRFRRIIMEINVNHRIFLTDYAANSDRR